MAPSSLCAPATALCWGTFAHFSYLTLLCWLATQHTVLADEKKDVGILPLWLV